MSGIADSMRIPNPRYPGSAARMSDGRLFTDCRPSCSLLQPLGTGMWAEFDRRAAMMKNGEGARGMDRMLTGMRTARTNCVDTMVPELTKRTVVWNGASEGPAHAVGIGAGRNALPGRPDLVGADPDVVARTVIRDCMLPGTWSPGALYAVGQAPKRNTSTTVRPSNRYAAPYGE